MKNVLLACCNHCQAAIDWSPITKSVPCICWGILGVIALYFLLKYVVAPLIANWHEKNMKDKAFKNEKAWDELRKTEREATMTKEKKDQIASLENCIEIEKAKNELLGKRLSIYEETFGKLNVEIKPKDNKQ